MKIISCLLFLIIILLISFNSAIGQIEISNENGDVLVIYPWVSEWSGDNDSNKKYQFILVNTSTHPIIGENENNLIVLGTDISLRARGLKTDFPRSRNPKYAWGYSGFFLVDDFEMFFDPVTIIHSYGGFSIGYFENVNIKEVLSSLDSSIYNSNVLPANSKWYNEWLKSTGRLKIYYTVDTWPGNGRKYRFVCIDYQDDGFFSRMTRSREAGSMVVFSGDTRVESKVRTRDGSNFFLVDDFDALPDLVTIAYIDAHGRIISFLQNVNLADIEPLKRGSIIPAANKKRYKKWMKNIER